MKKADIILRTFKNKNKDMKSAALNSFSTASKKTLLNALKNMNTCLINFKDEFKRKIPNIDFKKFNSMLNGESKKEQFKFNQNKIEKAALAENAETAQVSKKCYEGLKQIGLNNAYKKIEFPSTNASNLKKWEEIKNTLKNSKNQENLKKEINDFIKEHKGYKIKPEIAEFIACNYAFVESYKNNIRTLTEVMNSTKNALAYDAGTGSGGDIETMRHVMNAVELIYGFGFILLLLGFIAWPLSIIGIAMIVLGFAIYMIFWAVEEHKYKKKLKEHGF
ncbi:hypothetical protein FACS189465_1000 [Clostridia bacterium]|nr:hypothetical protein FACS189465_1000 [Clostridia bacterium]